MTQCRAGCCGQSPGAALATVEGDLVDAAPAMFLRSSYMGVK